MRPAETTFPYARLDEALHRARQQRSECVRDWTRAGAAALRRRLAHLWLAAARDAKAAAPRTGLPPLHPGAGADSKA